MTDVKHAHDAGYWARTFSRPLASCPQFAPGELGQPERDAWRTGWRKADEDLKRGEAIDPR